MLSQKQKAPHGAVHRGLFKYRLWLRNLGLSGLLSTDPRSRRDRLPAEVSSPKMIRSLSALAIFALLGTSFVVLPGFSPRVEARETMALAKADRLDGNCTQQVWPNFDRACLRRGDGLTVREARLVTARR
jgi:hypothetical protein